MVEFGEVEKLALPEVPGWLNIEALISETDRARMLDMARTARGVRAGVRELLAEVTPLMHKTEAISASFPSEGFSDPAPVFDRYTGYSLLYEELLSIADEIRETLEERAPVDSVEELAAQHDAARDEENNDDR